MRSLCYAKHAIFIVSCHNGYFGKITNKYYECNFQSLDFCSETHPNQYAVGRDAEVDILVPELSVVSMMATSMKNAV